MPTSLIKMNVVNVCFYHLGYHLDCKSKKLQVFRIVLSFLLLLRQSRSVLGNNKNISFDIIACLRLKKNTDSAMTRNETQADSDHEEADIHAKH